MEAPEIASSSTSIFIMPFFLSTVKRQGKICQNIYGFHRFPWDKIIPSTIFFP